MLPSCPLRSILNLAETTLQNVNQIVTLSCEWVKILLPRPHSQLSAHLSDPVSHLSLQDGSHLRAFAVTVTSAWNSCPQTFEWLFPSYPSPIPKGYLFREAFIDGPTTLITPYYIVSAPTANFFYFRLPAIANLLYPGAFFDPFLTYLHVNGHGRSLHFSRNDLFWLLKQCTAVPVVFPPHLSFCLSQPSELGVPQALYSGPCSAQAIYQVIPSKSLVSSHCLH